MDFVQSEAKESMCFGEPGINALVAKGITSFGAWKLTKGCAMFNYKLQTFHQSQIVLTLVKPNLGMDSRTC